MKGPTLIPLLVVSSLHNANRSSVAAFAGSRTTPFHGNTHHEISTRRAMTAISSDNDSPHPRSVPILTPSLDDPARFDHGCVANPVVLPPSPNQPKWQMYYYGNAGSWANDIPCFLPTGYTGLAESDDGVHWEKVDGLLENKAVIGPGESEEWDGVQTGVGDVIRLNNGTLIMYYFGGSNEELSMGPGRSILGFRMRIGRAVSVDHGRSWKKTGVCLDYDETEGLFASWPRIAHHDETNDEWRMIYHAFNGTRWRVFGANSSDGGITWHRDGLLLEGTSEEQMEDAFDGSGIGTRAILNDWYNGTLMVYEGVRPSNGKHSLGVAWHPSPTADLKTDHLKGGEWRKFASQTQPELNSGTFSLDVDPDNVQPILEPGTGVLGDWCEQVIGTPFLVRDPKNKSIRLYHCGKAGPEDKMSIGMVTSPDGNISPKSWVA